MFRAGQQLLCAKKLHLFTAHYVIVARMARARDAWNDPCWAMGELGQSVTMLGQLH